MKFEELYPDSVYLDQKDFEGDTVAKGILHQCCICHKEAYWCSISFLAYFCSEECLRKEWENYAIAYNNGVRESSVSL